MRNRRNMGYDARSAGYGKNIIWDTMHSKNAGYWHRLAKLQGMDTTCEQSERVSVPIIWDTTCEQRERGVLA